MSEKLTEQLAPQNPSEFEAFIENNKRMQQIVREMKEIPELPSEVPSDVHPLDRVEFPPEGGILTYMGGYEHPYRGFPFFEFVDKIDVIKKIQRGILSSLFHSFKKRPLIQKLGLIFVPWIFMDMVTAIVYTFYRMIERFRIKSVRYCTAMRELYRSMSVEWHDEKPEEREMRHMVRDIICMFLEMDNAYRFRFQDVFVELDKDALRKNASKEIYRLMSLMSSREKTQEIKDTWTLVLTFLPTFLWFNRPLKRAFVGILSELDLEKIALTVEDKHYCDKRKDYQFGFLANNNERDKLLSGEGVHTPSEIPEMGRNINALNLDPN